MLCPSSIKSVPSPCKGGRRGIPAPAGSLLLPTPPSSAHVPFWDNSKWDLWDNHLHLAPTPLAHVSALQRGRHSSNDNFNPIIFAKNRQNRNGASAHTLYLCPPRDPALPEPPQPRNAPRDSFQQRKLKEETFFLYITLKKLTAT